MHKGHHKQISKWNAKHPKVARKAFNIGEVWNPVCYHGNRLLSSFCGDLVESYRKESNISDKNWLRFFFPSYFTRKKTSSLYKEKNAVYYFQMSLRSGDIQVFKICKLANWDVK